MITNGAPRPRNEATAARHRRDVWLQIYMPFALAVLVFLAASVLTFVGSFGGALNNSVMADTATVWLTLPVIVVGVIAFLLVAAAVFGLGKLIGVIPPYLKQAQDFVLVVERRARQAADRVANPIISSSTRAAGLQQFVAGLRAALRRDD